MSYIILTPKHRIEEYLKDIGEIYTANGWGKDYSIPLLRKMFTPTYYLVAVEQRKAVGFLRAFTDGVLVTHLSEIIVAPNMQKKGIGTILIKSFIADFEHTTIYTEVLRSNAINLMLNNGFDQKPQLTVFAKSKK